MACAALAAECRTRGVLEQLLADIRTTLEASAVKNIIPSTDLAAALVAMEGRPWAELGKSAKPLTANKLARLLAPLGIAPERLGARTRGYVRNAFNDAFARYSPPAQPTNRPKKRDEYCTSDGLPAQPLP